MQFKKKKKQRNQKVELVGDERRFPTCVAAWIIVLFKQSDIVP